MSLQFLIPWNQLSEIYRNFRVVAPCWKRKVSIIEHDKKVLRQKLETATVELETATVELETATLKLETATVELETATVELETATLKLETATVELETATVEKSLLQEMLGQLCPAGEDMEQ